MITSRLKVLWFVFLMGFTADSLAVVGNFVSNQAELRKRYRRLYSLPVIQESNDRFRFDQATLLRYRGINILKLAGDNFEMAYQHGKLLKSVLPKSTAVDSARMVDNAVNLTYGHRPAFAAAAKRFIEKNYATQLIREAQKKFPAITQRTLERVFAISEASGLDLNLLLDGAVNPSVMMMLANGVAVKDETVRLSPSAGCTSFAAWNDYTADGEMVIGRNTDYPLTGAFETNATVFYFHPTGGQKYMAIISAGVHSSSVAGLNESGLYLVTHSLPSKFTGTDGIPGILWMNEILERSKSIDEAIAFITAHKAEVGWTYVIASTLEKRMVAVEVDNSGFGIRESKDGKFVQTNHYLSSQLKDHTLFFNESSKQETLSRFDRASLLLETFKGAFDESKAVRVLSDHTDTYSGRNHGYPNNIGAVTTATSLVYKPAKKQLWVATGLAPTSDNIFVAIPTPDQFDVDNFPGVTAPDLFDGTFAAEFPNRFASIKNVIQAKQALEYRNDVKKALAHTRKARELSPEVGHFALMEAMLLIREKRNAEATAVLEKALAAHMSEHGYALAHYYLGRLKADSGIQASAVWNLEKVLTQSSPDGALYSAAEKALGAVKKWGKYRLQWHEPIPQFQFGDSQHY